MNGRSWSGLGSSHFLFAIVVATVAMTGVALVLRNTGSSLAAAILGLYLLHLLSVRFILQAQRSQQVSLAEQFEQLHQLLGRAPVASGARTGRGATRPGPRTRRPEGGDESLDSLFARAARLAGPPELPVPRHFALGTVAIVRRVLRPSDVTRILLEQEQRPGFRFGDLAVELGLLTRHQLEELVDAQQRGLFTDAEIREARDRIESFRRHHAPSAA